MNKPLDLSNMEQIMLKVKEYIDRMVYHGTCETASGTNNKIVVIGNHTLSPNSFYIIKYTKGNSSTNHKITIDRNETKSVKIGGQTTTYAGNGTGGSYIGINGIMIYYYDGDVMHQIGSTLNYDDNSSPLEIDQYMIDSIINNPDDEYSWIDYAGIVRPSLLINNFTLKNSGNSGGGISAAGNIGSPTNPVYVSDGNITKTDFTTSSPLFELPDDYIYPENTYFDLLDVTLGAGWELESGTGRNAKYRHTAGNVAPLSFRYEIPAEAYTVIESVETTVYDEGTEYEWIDEQVTYKDVYLYVTPSCTDASYGNSFNIFKSTTPTGTDVTVASNAYYANDSRTAYISQESSRYTYNYINIVPASNFNGTFSLSCWYKIGSDKPILYLGGNSLSSENAVMAGGNGLHIGGGNRLGVDMYGTSFGINALQNIYNGDSNVALGFYSMHKSSYATDNTAVGANALEKMVQGHQNTVVGSYASQGCITATQNTVVGFGAMSSSDAVDWNCAFGKDSLKSLKNGKGCSAFGMSALSSAKGEYNTAIGFQALRSLSVGAHNTSIGQNSGTTRVSWDGSYGGVTANIDKSIYIGCNSKINPNNNGTNEIVIGVEAEGKGSNTITLGNTDITHIYAQVTAITALSDRRIKEDIEPANLEICKDTVLSLPVSRFKYKDFTGRHIDQHVTGWLADDVEKVFPKSVSAHDTYFPVLDEDGNKIMKTIEEKFIEDIIDQDENGNRIYRPEESIRETQIEETFLMEAVKDITMDQAVPTLWGAVQYLIKENEDLKNRIIELENRNK